VPGRNAACASIAFVVAGLERRCIRLKALSGHGFSRAVIAIKSVRLQPLGAIIRPSQLILPAKFLIGKPTIRTPRNSYKTKDRAPL
jgi:hypothetical protein